MYAALNTRTGEIVGQTMPLPTNAAFVVIVDNLTAHRTKAVTAFLDAHPRVPSSWFLVPSS